METALRNLLEVLTANDSDAQSQKTEKAEAVQKAEAVLNDKKAALTFTEKEVAEAQVALKDGQKKLLNASKHVEQYWVDAQEACDVADKFAKQLEAFKALRGEFEALRELETPAPP